MRSPTLASGAVVAALIGLGAASCRAQGYPASQRGRVDQTVAFTDISVVYGRPVARGRTLFGDSALAKWDVVWHPGADSATRVTFSRDVKLEGRDVKAGEYSVWLIPHANKPWTFILNRAAHVFHIPYPGEGSDVLRVMSRRSAAAIWRPSRSTFRLFCATKPSCAYTGARQWSRSASRRHIVRSNVA